MGEQDLEAIKWLIRRGPPRQREKATMTRLVEHEVTRPETLERQATLSLEKRLIEIKSQFPEAAMTAKKLRLIYRVRGVRKKRIKKATLIPKICPPHYLKAMLMDLREELKKLIRQKFDIIHVDESIFDG